MSATVLATIPGGALDETGGALASPFIYCHQEGIEDSLYIQAFVPFHRVKLILLTDSLYSFLNSCDKFSSTLDINYVRCYSI